MFFKQVQCLLQLKMLGHEQDFVQLVDVVVRLQPVGGDGRGGRFRVWSKEGGNQASSYLPIEEGSIERPSAQLDRWGGVPVQFSNYCVVMLCLLSISSD